MTVLKKIKSHPGIVDYFKELPFYNNHIEKPRVKCLKNIALISELPFYEELSVLKTNKTKLNTLTFQLVDHCQEVLMYNCLLNKKVQKKGLINSKNND